MGVPCFLKPGAWFARAGGSVQLEASSHSIAHSIAPCDMTALGPSSEFPPSTRMSEHSQSQPSSPQLGQEEASGSWRLYLNAPERRGPLAAG